MKKIVCDIIQDLLPSYCDKVTSNASNELIEEHMQECKKCQIALDNMNKNIKANTLDNKAEQINYLKGYNKRKKIIISISIILTIIILGSVFFINVLNKNILLDKLLYVDVNKFNVEYMYEKENGNAPIKEIEVYLYAEEYKNMYLTGGYELKENDTEIYYKIAAKELPQGVAFDSTGLKTSFIVNDNIERIYIEDTKHNKKEIWNKDMKIETEAEWRK